MDFKFILLTTIMGPWYVLLYLLFSKDVFIAKIVSGLSENLYCIWMTTFIDNIMINESVADVFCFHSVDFLHLYIRTNKPIMARMTSATPTTIPSSFCLSLRWIWKEIKLSLMCCIRNLEPNLKLNFLNFSFFN